MSTPEEQPPRPRTRQHFSLSSTPELSPAHPQHEASTPSALPREPASPNNNNSSSNSKTDDEAGSTLPPSRSRSALNLTASTLFGIFGQSDYAPDRDDTTPWGTGAQTPSIPARGHGGSSQVSDLRLDAAEWSDASRRRRRSLVQDEAARRSSGSGVASGANNRRTAGRRGGRARKARWGEVAYKTFALGAVGLAYGVLISQLHDRQQIAPVRVDEIPHKSRWYLVFWAVVAIVIGWAMPLVDGWWDDDIGGSVQSSNPGKGRRFRGKPGVWAPQWNDVVRSIGAFVGIAFAIRRLPWQSTLQLSLTLALCNPAIWFLLDRSSPGLVFSSTVAIAGTALCVAINPNIIPAPSSRLNSHVGAPSAAPAGGDVMRGVLAVESVAVTTWIASVLFFSAVCFGNIGRRL